jgi:ribosome-associated translation inhibitor RaiA
MITICKSEIPQDVAQRAYRATSFTPEKRGESARQDYVNDLTSIYNELHAQIKPDQEDLLDELFATFKDRYRRGYLDTLHSHSRIMSSMITGPANFPVRRNEKANNAYQNKWNTFIEGRERGIKRIEKILGIGNRSTAISSDDENAIDKLKAKLEKLEKYQADMKQVNAIAKKKGIDGLAEIGWTPEQIDKLKAGMVHHPWDTKPCPSFRLTNNNANIKRVKERISKLERQAGDADVKIPFDGGTIHDNVEANRLQILFDDKPDAGLRAELKKHGFKWSPSNQAWQRFRSPDAMYYARQIVGL